MQSRSRLRKKPFGVSHFLGLIVIEAYVFRALCVLTSNRYILKKPTKTNLDVEVFQSVENYRDIYVHVMRMFCLAIV